MRRSTRLGLAVAVLLLLVLGAYTAFWFYVAGRIKDGVVQWAETARGNNLDLSWHGIRVAGYPLAFRIELSEARLRDNSAGPGWEGRAPSLSASARPWNFRAWQLRASDGIGRTAGPTSAPLATLTAGTAEGSVVMIGEHGGANIWLRLGDAAVDAAATRIAAREAAATLTLPERPPQTHTEPAVGVALQLRDLTLPAVPTPLRNPVDEVALALTVKGDIPPGPARQAAQTWRDAGGTLELDNLAVRWGTLAVTGSGTAALDPEMQPIGAFSGSIEGAEELLAAFVAAGRMRASDAGFARLALTALAKPGPNGRPQIAASFTIQNGQMSLGPVKLGKAPRITWD